MFETMITLSTAHITEETSHLLDDEWVVDKWGLIVYAKGSYGWFIHIPEDVDFSTEDCKTPQDLRRCIQYTINVDCEWLCLDRDGDIVDELPTYDW